MTKLTLEQEQEQVRIDLAAMFRLTAHFGWDDTVWNHITARVPGSEHHFYMHRFGLHYSEVSASNLIKVDEEGKVIEGPSDVNTAGFIIHSAVHLNHAESKFVFHAQCSTVKLVTMIGKAYPLIRMSATALPSALRAIAALLCAIMDF